EDLAVDPELARLLLRQRVRPVDAAERGARRGRVAAAEVVPLPTAAVVQDRRSPVGVAHTCEPGGDLGDGDIPGDRFVRPVAPPSNRRGEAVAAVLVVVEP